MIESVRSKIDSVRENVNQATVTSEGGQATSRGKVSSAARDALAALRNGKGFVKLEADKCEGKGCFSAPPAVGSSGTGNSGSNLASSTAAAAGGGVRSAAGGAISNADATESESKPWYLCCC